MAEIDQVRDFTGNPNPTPKAPRPVAQAPASAPEEGGGGTAVAAAPAAPERALKASFRVSADEDGKQSVYMMDDNFETTRLGPVSIGNADDLLHAMGTFNPKTASWSVPEKAARELISGDLPLPDYIPAKYRANKAVIANGLIWTDFLRGNIDLEEAQGRGDLEALKMQIKEAPLFVWQGDVSKTAAKMWSDLKEAGPGGVLRRVAGETAGQAAFMTDAPAAAAVGIGLMAPVIASKGAAAAAVVPAVAMLLENGLVFKRSYEIEGGNAAGEMIAKGFDEATVKKYAPLVGVMNGAIETVGFHMVPAPYKRVIAQKVLGAAPVRKALAKAYVNYMKELGTEVGTEVAQEMVNVYAENMAAETENKPDLKTTGEQALNRFADIALKTLAGTGGMKVPGTVLEAGVQRAAKRADVVATAKTEARIAQDLAAGLPQEAGKPDLAAALPKDAGKADLSAALPKEAGTPAAAPAAEAALPTSPTDGADAAVADFDAGRAAPEDVVAALPAAAEDIGDGKSAPRLEVEAKAAEVAREAAITAVDSDIVQVNTDLAALYRKRQPLAAQGKPLQNVDRQINALLDRKETLIKEAADLKTAPRTELGRGMKLEMKAATLADIVDAGFAAGGKEAETQARAEMAVAEAEFAAAKGEIRAEAKARLDAVKGKLSALAERVKSRPKMLKEIADANGLTGPEVTQLIRRGASPALMSDAKFDEFVEEFRAKAEYAKEWKAARGELAKVLKEKNLKGESRLRKMRNLPTTRQMNIQQLKDYADVIAGYEKDDVILSEKRTEALKNTEFAGADTMRAIATKAAAYLKKPLAALKGAEVTEWSAFTPDTQLAAKHPFFEYMVRRAKDARREGIALALAFRDVNNKLAADAIASRARMSMGERLASWFIPQQKAVFEYIEEQDAAAKAEKAALLTPEEIKWADNWTDFAEKAYEYLLQVHALEGSNYEGAYVPHVRRSLKEMLLGIKDTGVKGFVREFKQRFEMAETDVTAVDTDGKPLGFQKFLKNTLRRSGKMAPSMNLPVVMNSYAEKIYQKVALDKLVPAVDSLVVAMNAMDRSVDQERANALLHKFVRAFLNSKKGNSPWAFQQGGVIETVQRFGTNMASLAYINLNFALQAASPVGATIVELPVLGNKGMLLAKARRLTPKGRAIVAKYKAFTGDTLADAVSDPGKSVPEKMGVVANGMWALIHHEVMSDLLLGSMTAEEYAAGTISEDRLTDIEVKAGRWIDIRGSKSVRGSSVTGAGWTQFKGWMIPPLLTTAENAYALARAIGTLGKQPMTKEQMIEVAYMAEMAAVGLLVRGALGEDDPDDKTFSGNFKRYLRSEVFSHISALNVGVFLSAPAGVAWLVRLAHNLALLAHFEDETKQARGAKGLKRQIPFASFIRAVAPDEEK